MPDLPAIDQFLHLNQKTKLEIVEAKIRTSPRVARASSRHRFQQPEASYTSALSHTLPDNASSENATKALDDTKGLDDPPGAKVGVDTEHTPGHEKQISANAHYEIPKIEIVEQGISVGKVQFLNVKDNSINSYQYERQPPGTFPHINQIIADPQKSAQVDRSTGIAQNADLGFESIRGDTANAYPTEEAPSLTPDERQRAAIMQI